MHQGNLQIKMMRPFNWRLAQSHNKTLRNENHETTRARPLPKYSAAAVDNGLPVANSFHGSTTTMTRCGRNYRPSLSIARSSANVATNPPHSDSDQFSQIDWEIDRGRLSTPKVSRVTA